MYCEAYDDNDSDNEIEMEADDEEAPPVEIAQQISLTEYEKQKVEFTKQEIDKLIHSPQYQTRHNTCSSCWSIWIEGMCRSDCMECDGFALTRPCPICQGKCGITWKRDVDMSHSNNEAHWSGECGLPWDQQKLHMQLLFTDASEETILDGMDSLTT